MHRPSILTDAYPVPVRPEVLSAQAATWAALGKPGSWWSAAERQAIVREARAAVECDLCRERKRALSPYGLPGRHEGSGPLPAPYVDAIHRVVTDPGRLTAGWLDELRSEGLEDGPYVELLGVLVTTMAVDVFRRTLGVEPPELPAAHPGAPSRQRPDGARRDVAWVPMVPADVGLDDVYDGIPIIPYVRQALSLVPDEARRLLELEISHYLPLDAMRRPGDNAGHALDRLQIELIATRVSFLHDCFY